MPTLLEQVQTFEGALDAIAALPVEWCFGYAGRIRTKRPDGRHACPVCELEPSHKYDLDDVYAARLMGMPEDLSLRIATAADHAHSPDRPALLRACRLTTPQPA